MPSPDFSKTYLPQREVIEWLESVTKQEYKQIYDSIEKARGHGQIKARKRIGGKECIHVESFKIWAVSRPRAWRGVFADNPAFPTIVRLTGVESKGEVGSVKQYSFDREKRKAITGAASTPEGVDDLIRKFADRDDEIVDLKRKLQKHRDKSSQMSEYGKKAKGSPKKLLHC